VVELLKQREHATLSWVDQVLMLFLLRYNFLDNIAVAQVHECAQQFVEYIKLSHPNVYQTIFAEGDITEDMLKTLTIHAREFSLLYVPIKLD
jgi:F0F1-type ATP synthase alpha subunit